MSEERRAGHPFHMYDAIFAQPEAFVRVLEKNGAAVDQFAAGASSCERLFFVGIGTSYHAARIGVRSGLSPKWAAETRPPRFVGESFSFLRSSG